MASIHQGRGVAPTFLSLGLCGILALWRLARANLLLRPQWPGRARRLGSLVLVSLPSFAWARSLASWWVATAGCPVPWRNGGPLRALCRGLAARLRTGLVRWIRARRVLTFLAQVLCGLLALWWLALALAAWSPRPSRQVLPRVYRRPARWLLSPCLVHPLVVFVSPPSRQAILRSCRPLAL